MTLLLTQINYFAKGSSTAQDIDDFSSVTISLGSEIKNNECRILLKNNPVNVFADGTLQHKWVDSTGVIVFGAVKARAGTIIPEENVDIYALYTEIDPTLSVESNSYLLFQGVITKGKIKYSESEHPIELYCQDRNAVAMDKLSIPQGFSVDDDNNAPELVQIFFRNIDGLPSGSYGFDADGVRAKNYPYYIDARLFSDYVMSTGSCTSVSSNLLIDSGATFISDGVEVDDWVRNSSDESYAYVVSVDSETQLTLSKHIFTVSGEDYQVSDGFIQDRRAAESYENSVKLFPSTGYSVTNQPLTKVVSDLSQIEKTNTYAELTSTGAVVKRGARWFIDRRGRLHWYIPDDTPSYIMSVGTSSAISPDMRGHIIQNLDLDNEVRGKVNFIIYKAGEDMDNLQVSGYARAKFSGTPMSKDAFRDYSDIARRMKSFAEQLGEIVKVKSDEYDYPASYSPLPSGGNYPVWDTVKDTVPLDDDDYNDLFIRQQHIFAKMAANSEFQKFANPRWAGKIQLRGENINVGDLIQFTSKTHGIKDILVRVKGVSHSFSSQGWITSVDVEEDELIVNGKVIYM